MGARPTRPLRLQPTWTATYKDGSVFLHDEEGRLECLLPGRRDPMCHHWKQENIHFTNELANWRKFKKYQQDLQHLDRLETGLDLRNLDASSINALNRLSDWQDFEAFQYHNLTDAINFEDHCRQEFLKITEWEASTEQSSSTSPPHGAFGAWLCSFNKSQESIEAAKKQLTWIRDQWPKVATEAFASVSMTLKLQSSLEGKFEKQTLTAFSAIQKLGGRPSHAVRPPDGSMDVVHRILYWISETSRYKDELLHWKHFLEWRQVKLGEDSTMRKAEYQCPKLESVLEYSAMVEEFRQLQHESALTWLERWRRVVSWYEEQIEAPRWHEIKTETSRQHFPPSFLYVYAEEARSHVESSEQAVADAAARLGKARQEHAYVLSEHGQSLGDEIAVGIPQKPCLTTPSPPKSNSLQSSQSSSFSSSQLSISSPSPASSNSSQPSVSPQSPPTSHSTPSSPSSVRTRTGRALSDKGSSADKQRRRSNKKNARKKERKIQNIDTEQQALPISVFDSHNVEDDDDVQMEKAPEESLRSENREQSCGVDFEDTVMTEVKDPPTPIISQPSQPSSPIANTKFKKSPLPTQDPIPKKIRSATKLDQGPNSRVQKNTTKKSAKKAKAFTEQQTMTLLDAASNESTTIISPPLRRSERLMEKATLSAATAVTQRNAAQPSPPSQQTQPRGLPSSSESSGSPSTQKKRKREPEMLEPLPGSAQPEQKRRRIR